MSLYVLQNNFNGCIEIFFYNLLPRYTLRLFPIFCKNDTMNVHVHKSFISIFIISSEQIPVRRWIGQNFWHAFKSGVGKSVLIQGTDFNNEKTEKLETCVVQIKKKRENQQQSGKTLLRRWVECKPALDNENLEPAEWRCSPWLCASHISQLI